MKELIESDRSPGDIIQIISEQQMFRRTFFVSELEQGLASWFREIFAEGHRPNAIAIASDLAKDLEYAATQPRGRRHGRIGLGDLDGEEHVVEFEIIEGGPEEEVEVTIYPGIAR